MWAKANTIFKSFRRCCWSHNWCLSLVSPWWSCLWTHHFQATDKFFSHNTIFILFFLSLKERILVLGLRLSEISLLYPSYRFPLLLQEAVEAFTPLSFWPQALPSPLRYTQMACLAFTAFAIYSTYLFLQRVCLPFCFDLSAVPAMPMVITSWCFKGRILHSSPCTRYAMPYPGRKLQKHSFVLFQLSLLIHITTFIARCRTTPKRE